MMNQENFVNINDLHAQGWTISEIAEETGWHRTTVSKYLKHGPPPAARTTEPSVMTEAWQTRLNTMLKSWPKLQSVSVHNKLRAVGFEGSYPTVVRAVRDIRGPRQLGRPLRVERQARLFRDDPVVVAVSDVVVHDLGGPASHLRGHRPVLR